jgi:hypothetical protein
MVSALWASIRLRKTYGTLRLRPSFAGQTGWRRRLAGEKVEMTIPTEGKGLFTKLFGRRAA